MITRCSPLQHYNNHTCGETDLVLVLEWRHMNTMVSQMISKSTVCSAVCPGVSLPGRKPMNHQSFALLIFCKGKPRMTGGFPSQRASTKGNIAMFFTPSCMRVCIMVEYGCIALFDTSTRPKRQIIRKSIHVSSQTSIQLVHWEMISLSVASLLRGISMGDYTDAGSSVKSEWASYCLRLTLQWRHDGRDGVSNHQPHDCLLNRLFRHRSKKISKLQVAALCVGNSPVTGEFPAQRTSNAENVLFDDVIMK